MSCANIRMSMVTVYNCINLLFGLEGNVISYGNYSVIMNIQYPLDLEVSTLTTTHF